jgi:hypothetical protein
MQITITSTELYTERNVFMRSNHILDFVQYSYELNYFMQDTTSSILYYLSFWLFLDSFLLLCT